MDPLLDPDLPFIAGEGDLARIVELAAEALED